MLHPENWSDNLTFRGVLICELAFITDEEGHVILKISGCPKIPHFLAIFRTKGGCFMIKENIRVHLETICQYNSIRITQLFAKEDTHWIRVRCIPDTHILELTYLETETVDHHESIEEAAEAIYNALYPSMTS